MFQPWFVELISVISDICVGLSALIVAIAAALGLSQWRSELKGKAQLEMARRLTLLAYTFRDQYISARSMFTFPQESIDREKLPSEEQKETNYRNEYFARRNRVRLLQDTMRELIQAAWEADVVFDRNVNVEDLIEPLGKSFDELFDAVGTYFSRHIERTSKGASPDEYDSPWLKEHREIVYGHAEDKHAKAVTARAKYLVETIKSAVKS